MIVLHNLRDFLAHWQYKDWLPRVYPRRYPCVLKKEWRGCGIMGDELVHYIAYPPATKSGVDAFAAGIEATWHIIECGKRRTKCST